mmetsp:Transcript_142118/g.317991  ORF Transcript_142118/g.317991 Transcript_142118/m.317991 type:complete len:240 (+) Transcript_142118:55-774(+)
MMTDNWFKTQEEASNANERHVQYLLGQGSCQQFGGLESASRILRYPAPYPCYPPPSTHEQQQFCLPPVDDELRALQDQTMRSAYPPPEESVRANKLQRLGQDRAVHPVDDEDHHSKRFEKNTRGLLERWMVDHWEYPYPDSAEEDGLMAETHLTRRQIKTWMTNYRRRKMHLRREKKEKRDDLKSMLSTPAENISMLRYSTNGRDDGDGKIPVVWGVPGRCALVPPTRPNTVDELPSVW